MLNSVSLIRNMKHNSDLASEVIDQNMGLKKHSEFNEINFHDLEIKMEMLQDHTSKIVTEIGKDGIRPISTNPDELVLGPIQDN